jgi:microcystin-dependent protein
VGAVPSFTAAGSSYGTTEDGAMSATMVGPNFGGSAHANLPPFLVLNWCIAVEGVFPQRS